MNKLFFTIGLLIVSLATTVVFADDMQDSQGGQMNNSMQSAPMDSNMSQDSNMPQDPNSTPAQPSDMFSPGQDSSGAGSQQQTQGGY